MPEGRVKAVAFDVDGTLVRENFWGALNRAGGLAEPDDMLFFELYADGKLGYREWMERISATYRANPPAEDDVLKMLCTYAFAPGAEETVRALARFPMALISSNIDAYVEDVAKTLGIAHAYSYAAIEYSGGRFSGIGFRSEKSELGAKVEALEDFAAKAGIEVQDIAFVGDSRNDLDAFTATGRGILIGEGNEDLRRAAWRRVSTLSEIPEIL